MNGRSAAHSLPAPSRTYGLRHGITTKWLVFNMNILVIVIAVMAIVWLF